MLPPHIQKTLEYFQWVRVTGEWLVLVCDRDETMTEVCRILTAALAPVDKFSGRTATLQPHGHVSVVAGVDDPFLKDQAFVVAFMGLWMNTGEMGKWRSQASKILD